MPDQHTSNSNKGMTHHKIQTVYAATRYYTIAQTITYHTATTK